MKYLKIVLIALAITLPLQLVGAILLLFILPFIPKDRETLPDIFAWFDNAEIRLGRGKMDDGLAGYPGYREEMSKYPLFITRYIWLAWRNPINYFQYKVLGFNVGRGIVSASINTNVTGKVGNKEGNVAGTSELIVRTYDGRSTFDYYKVIKLTSTRCLRIRLGHKVGSELIDYQKIKPNEYLQFVCTFNLAEYKGK